MKKKGLVMGLEGFLNVLMWVVFFIIAAGVVVLIVRALLAGT
jgi:hypothetical protein